MFKKSDLKTGMFGKMSDGDMFVIVDDLIVYEGCQGFDRVETVKDDLRLRYYSIDYLVKANTFHEAEYAIESRENIIWERNPPKKIPTMKEVFYKRNPNAPHDVDGEPKVCPGDVDASWENGDCRLRHNCTCIDCWSRPIPNAEEVV